MVVRAVDRREAGSAGHEVSREIVARALALLAVLPALGSFHLRAALMGRDRALEGSTQWLGLIPGVLGEYLRRAFLAQTLAECAPTATIGFGVLFSRAGARIGEQVYIGPRCHIGLAHIGRDVLLAAGVHVPSGARTHGTGRRSHRRFRDQETTYSVVRIGEGTWVGSAAVVMADVGAACGDRRGRGGHQAAASDGSWRRACPRVSCGCAKARRTNESG